MQFAICLPGKGKGADPFGEVNDGDNEVLL